MTLVERLLHALKERGAGEIFGIPGDFALPFFKIAETAAILPLHTMSHEPGVGFAADAAARFRGTLGVAAVTYGAGAFNLVNAVAGAYAEKSPVVVLSGAPGRHEGSTGLLLHHQGRTLDTQYRVFEEVTCAQARLDDAERAPAEIARVLQAAAEHSRPVYLEIPRDMVAATTGPVAAPILRRGDPDAVAAAADAVMARLAKAARPLVMVDVEVRRFGLEAKVAELVRRLGVPVVTTFMGRGLLSGESTLVGTYLGVAGDPAISALVEGSDAILLLGVILSDTNFAVSAGKLDLRATIQAFDREVRMGFHVYPELPLADLVEALLERAAPVGRASAPIEPKRYPRGLVADAAPIAPMDIAAAVNDLFDAKGPMPIACDMGDCLFTAMDIAHTDLVAPGYYAGMGFGVPAGIGAQLATGRRALVLVGDGAFQMTGWELGNCRRLGIDPIVIVFNNMSWEMLRAFQPESGFNDLDDWHFADAAAALGGEGRRVASRAELKAALAAASAARGRFQLIEAMIPRGVLSDTLARFVAGQKTLHRRPA